MKRAFPLYTFAGFSLLIVSEILHLRKVDPFYRWFYSFAWWSYILTIDGVIFYLNRNSLIMNRTREFAVMIPWSVFLWLIFEAANLSLKNWYYINLPNSRLERWAGYFIAYGTVLPAIFETAELLESAGLFKGATSRNIKVRKSLIVILFLAGLFCLGTSILVPRYFFPLIWICFILLLEPINYQSGARSLLKDLEQGFPRKIYLLLASGLVCGILWEFWNFWARSKWVYTVPFFEDLKGFEMPYLGFLGFPPFAIQVYVMYNTILLFRRGKGWEHTTSKQTLMKKEQGLTGFLGAVLIVSFSVLMFDAIDKKTVDSFESRLQDAYWIPPDHRKQLVKIGIQDLETLLKKTAETKELQEMALRLHVSKEDLITWRKKAELAELKGLGIKNLKILECAGIDSVLLLAQQDPEKLGRRIESTHCGKETFSAAKIRIWVKEARKALLRDHAELLR